MGSRLPGSMSEIAIFRQLSTKSNVCDVCEQGRTPDSGAPYNQSQKGRRHSIWVPTVLLPCVRKIIHCGSEFVGSKYGEQPDDEEECCHC